MRRERFEQLVANVLESLPAEFVRRLDSIDVVIEDWPTPDQLSKVGVRRPQDLLGLYEGIPLTKRTTGLTAKLPDKITLFQKPIQLKCRSESEVVDLIREVLYHEIGHYFGIDEKRMAEIEGKRSHNPCV